MKRIPNILFTMQDTDTRKKLEAYLAGAGYRVCMAVGTPPAADLIHSEPIDVMVCDNTGTAATDTDRSGGPGNVGGMYVICVQETGATAVVSPDADAVLAWPVDKTSFLASVASGVRIAGLERQMSTLAEQKREALAETTTVLVMFLRMYNNGLADHCRRVSDLSVELAQRRGDVPQKALQTLRAAGLLHDIGMTVLPEALLSKRRTERTGEEQQRYLSHPVVGETLLREVRSLTPVARLVRWHHEQFNGCGFPDGLQGTAIPLLARIIASASVYDNLVHRGRVPLDRVPEHLQRFSGYQLDPALVDLLLDINRGRIHEEARRSYRQVYVEDLKVGMTLARSVQTASGATAVPENTRLTPDSIEKLKEYIFSDSLSDTFFIYK